MSDLISRQNLENAKFVSVINEYTLGWNDAIDAIIQNEPSAQRKGKWIRMTADGVYWHECSECHEKPLLNRWHKQDEMSKFCPNCGSRMEGPDD